MKSGIFICGTIVSLIKTPWSNGNGETHEIVISRSYIDQYGRQNFDDFKVRYNPQSNQNQGLLRDNIGAEVCLEFSIFNRQSQRDPSRRWVEYFTRDDAQCWLTNDSKNIKSA